MVATEPHPSKHMALHISNNFLVPYNDIHIVYNVPFNLKHLALSICGKFPFPCTFKLSMIYQSMPFVFPFVLAPSTFTLNISVPFEY